MILVPFGEGWREGSRTGGSKEDLQIIKTWMCMYHICYHSFGISIFFSFLAFPQMRQRVQRNLIDYISFKIKTRSFSCPKIFHDFMTSFTSLQSCLISCFLQYTMFFHNSGPSHIWFLLLRSLMRIGNMSSILYCYILKMCTADLQNNLPRFYKIKNMCILRLPQLCNC